jgi:hypothetical protein
MKKNANTELHVSILTEGVPVCAVRPCARFSLNCLSTLASGLGNTTWTQNNCELEKRHSKKDGKGKGVSTTAKCLSMYSISENIYYSQLSSVALLLQPEPVSHRIVQWKDLVLSHPPHVLSPCSLPLPPTCLLATDNEARSYFASTIETSVSKEYAASIFDPERNDEDWLQIKSIRVYFKCFFLGVEASLLIIQPHNLHMH